MVFDVGVADISRSLTITAAPQAIWDVLADFGWPDPVDIGGIEGSRELEAICIAWVKIGGTRGSWDHGFTLLAG